MPDEFEDLLKELQMLDDPKADDPEPEKDPEEEPAEAPEADVDGEENVDEKPAEEEKPEAKKTAPADSAKKEKDEAANRAFAELRAKSSRYEKLLKRLAEGSNKDLDEYIGELEEKAIERQAKKMGTDPALLKRLEALEEENRAYQAANTQNYLQSEFTRVQNSLKLSDEELQEFTAQLVAEQHDFKNLKVDYVKLYKGYNHDKLVEKERQSWISRDDKSRQGASMIKPGRRDTGPRGEITTLEDLDRILDSRNKK